MCKVPGYRRNQHAAVKPLLAVGQTDVECVKHQLEGGVGDPSMGLGLRVEGLEFRVIYPQIL